MKARVLSTHSKTPLLKEGDIVEIIPGMETDSEGIWNIPAGRLFLCKTEDGLFSYIIPKDLQLLPEEADTDIDWDAFGRIAAKDILCSLIHDGRMRADASTVKSSIWLADELIAQLKEG